MTAGSRMIQPMCHLLLCNRNVVRALMTTFPIEQIIYYFNCLDNIANKVRAFLIVYVFKPLKAFLSVYEKVLI